MLRWKTALAVILVGLLSMATESVAQATASRTKGFNLGLALNGSAIKLDDEDVGDSETENGGGIALHAGYNFTPNLGAFIGLTGASIQPNDGGSYGLGHGDLGVRLLLGTSSFVPYVEAAFTGLNAQGDIDGDDVEFSGTGFTGALGLNYFLSQKLALDVAFKYTKGEFNTIKIGGQSVSDDDGLGVSTGRFNIGIAWYPSAGNAVTPRSR